MRRISFVLLLCVAVIPLLFARPSTYGQEEPLGEIIVVAANLASPRGFVVGPDEVFYIGSAGRGGERPGDMATVPDAPLFGGTTASVVRVEAGCGTIVVDRLPSAVGAAGRTLGVSDVAVFNDQFYVLVTGGGAGHGNPDRPNGLYRLEPDGTTALFADVSAWIRSNPVAAPKPLDSDPDGLLTSMTVVGDEFWIVEANGGQVLRVASDGTIGRVVDLSATRLVLTAVIPDDLGNAYVAAMGTEPFLDRAGKVIRITPAGDVVDVWTGLTAVVGLARDADGTLYALEAATGNSIGPPYLTRRSGRVLRQTGLDTREVVVRRLHAPISMAIGPDSLLYVTVPGEGSSDSAILRIDPAARGPMTAPKPPYAGPVCKEAEA